GDIGDFDATIVGSSLGDSGFGLIYATHAAQDDGYAVLIHPAQFQAVIFKQLIAGQPDRNIQRSMLASPMPGVALTLRVVRRGAQVTVYLNGAQLFIADDGSMGATGQLGVIESTTDQTQNAGAQFDSFCIASESIADAGVD